MNKGLLEGSNENARVCVLLVTTGAKGQLTLTRGYLRVRRVADYYSYFLCSVGTQQTRGMSEGI